MGALRLCFVGPASSVSLRRWVEWFACRGHDTTIITVEPAETPLVEKFLQIDVGMSLGPRKFSRLVSAARMALTVRRLKPDLLHVHYVRGLAWGLLLNRFHPCVVTPWGSDVLGEQGAFRESYSRRLTRAVLRMADLVTVHSEYMETQVRALLTSARPVARIGWGVDLRLFRPGLDVRALRVRWGIGEDQRVIFSPRLTQPFYNHDRILRAIPTVCEKIPEVLLVIAEQHADQGYVTGLRRLALDLGVAERVKFVGSIPYQDMPLWYNLARAVVMVPQSDGMPNSLLEAMACGAVPVLNRLPQYAEMIRHGENGFLVDPEQGDLAGPLVGVLSDAGAREHIARRNLEKVKEVADQEREMSRMESFYDQLVSAGRGRRVVLSRR
ncbi:MAG: glycosyltransferase family 4 protein [Nitrospiraceae bacterium]